MKTFVFSVLLMLPAAALATPPGVSQPPVFNPFTGALDYVGPGNGLTSGSTYYLFNSTDSATNAFFTFSGSEVCLYVNSTSVTCFSHNGGYVLLETGTTPATNFLLLEDNSFVLLEDGSKVVIE